MKVQFNDAELRTIIDEHPSLKLDERASDTDSTEERVFDLNESVTDSDDSEDLVRDHKAWEGDGELL